MYQVLIIVLATSLIFYFMKMNSKKKPVVNLDSSIEYRSGSLVLILGLVPFCIGLVILYIAIWVFQSDNKDAAWFLLFASLFMVLIGLPNVLSGLLYKIVTNEHNIKQRTIFNTWKKLDWNQIEATSFFKLNKDFILKGDGVKIRCNVYLKGFPLLANEIIQRTRIPQNEIDLPEIYISDR